MLCTHYAIMYCNALSVVHISFLLPGHWRLLRQVDASICSSALMQSVSALLMYSVTLSWCILVLTSQCKPVQAATKECKVCDPVPTSGRIHPSGFVH